MPHTSLRVVGLAVLLFSSTAANAQEITFNFTGVITQVSEGGLTGAFAVGQEVSGSYTFDSTAVDQDPSTVVGLYENVIRFEYSVPAANYHATGVAGSRPGFIEVLNNEDGVRDRYVVQMWEPDQDVSGPDVGPYTLMGFSLVMRDRTTVAVSSDALPLVPPSLADFAFGVEVDMGFFTPFDPATGISGDGLVFAELTSLTVSSVTGLLNDLVQRIISLNLQGGISNSLDAKLNAVMSAIDDSNQKDDGAAKNAMYAFINAVEAQRGKSLTDAQADQLIGVAQAVIAALGS